MGSYALTELKYAKEKWLHPRGRVLPVLVREVPLEQIPGYLSSATILRPDGNIDAEVVHAIRPMAAALWRRALLWVTTTLGICLVIGIATSTLLPQRHADPLSRPTATGHTIGGTFDFSEFRSGEELNVLGDAVTRGDSLLLTPLATYKRGAVWYRRRVHASEGFQTSFIFGTQRNSGQPGSDGIAFVVQADGPDAVGHWGGNLGYDGIRNSVAIE